MAQPNQQFNISGYGFQGMNTEMEPVGGDLSFALKADNCVIDRVGRISARETFTPAVNFKEGQLGDYPDVDITAISAYFTPDSPDHHVVCTALLGTYIPESKPVTRIEWNGEEEIDTFDFDNTLPYEYRLYWDDGRGLRQCSFPDMSSSEALARSLYVHFKDDLYLFATGLPFMKYDGRGGWTAVAHTPPTDTSGINGDIAISAYGRLWVSGVDGDYQTIHYSDLLREDQWYDASADPEDDFNTGGKINVNEYWPVEYDEIVNIHAHNGLLIVFGKQSILIYGNAGNGDPAGEDGIFLQDAISNVGLVERDALANIGTDVVFCDDTGIRSLGRVIQEKSNPIAEPSLNVKRDFMQMIKEERASKSLVAGIRLCYFPTKALFVALFRSTSIAYAFGTERPSSTGGAMVTRWTNCWFASMYFAEAFNKGIPYLGGRDDRAVLVYEGYRSEDSYEFRFESMALGISQGQMMDIMSKSIIYLLSSEAIPLKAKALWGFEGYLNYEHDFKTNPKGSTEYNVAQWGVDEYLGSGTGIWRNKVNTMGSGTFLRVGLSAQVDKIGFSIQEIAVNTAVGRLVA
jgi:hypothetical protein